MKRKRKGVFRRLGRFWVYIVECRDGTYYTGYTPDLKKRIESHNKGAGAKYTRARLPVRLVWKRGYDRFRLALKTEIAVKRLTRLQKEALVKGRRLDGVF